MPSGVSVKPPDDTPAYWEFRIHCPCGYSSLLQISDLVRLAGRLPIEQIAFESLIQKGWQIEPPRCPRCR